MTPMSIARIVMVFDGVQLMKYGYFAREEGIGFWRFMGSHVLVYWE